MEGDVRPGRAGDSETSSLRADTPLPVGPLLGGRDNSSKSGTLSDPNRPPLVPHVTRLRGVPDSSGSRLWPSESRVPLSSGTILVSPSSGPPLCTRPRLASSVRLQTGAAERLGTLHGDVSEMSRVHDSTGPPATLTTDLFLQGSLWGRVAGPGEGGEVLPESVTRHRASGPLTATCVYSDVALGSGPSPSLAASPTSVKCPLGPFTSTPVDT